MMEQKNCASALKQNADQGKPKEEVRAAEPEGRADSDAVRPLLRTLLFLALPTVAEEILATLLQYVDTAMVGQLGEQATASVSITTNITWLVNSVPGAIGTAMLVLIAKALGAGDRSQVRKLSQQALFLAAASGAVVYSCLDGSGESDPGGGLPLLFHYQHAAAFPLYQHGAGSGPAGCGGYEDADADKPPGKWSQYRI